MLQNERGEEKERKAGIPVPDAKLEQERGVHKIRGERIFVAHSERPRTPTLTIEQTPLGLSGRKFRLLDSLRYPHVGARGGDTD